MRYHDLPWTGGSTSEDRFDIERATDGRAFRLVASVGPNVTRYSDTERIRPSTTYLPRARRQRRGVLLSVEPRCRDDGGG